MDEFEVIIPVGFVPPEPLANVIVRRVQKRLDEFAQTRGYDNVLSACTYVSSAVFKFAQEGSYCVKVRDDSWNALYAILAEVTAGTRVVTCYEDVESDLPVLEWPQ